MSLSHMHTENDDAHHAHAHHGSGGLKEANRQWFDSKAHSDEGGYEAQPAAQEISSKISAAILDAFPFNKNQTVMMDFACGTGMISQRLVPHTKSIIGVDISPKSVEFFNERAAGQGVSPEQMKAICADLTERGQAQNDLFGGILFDAIICSVGYHHFDDVAAITKKLVSYLKPGIGTLVIVDFIESPEAEHILKSHGHIVGNTGGFNEDMIKSTLVREGGLQDFSFKPSFQAVIHEKVVNMFIAKGVRPSL
ncbi:S-adenosyl-L-methionine-dependent methyltransferase [Rhizoctonia solani]|nr:S-adenosyl-L-methionine-dependent methyltransferase [Rhizoctonia solani]